jgi:hypothetical protein
MAEEEWIAQFTTAVHRVIQRYPEMRLSKVIADVYSDPWLKLKVQQSGLKAASLIGRIRGLKVFQKQCHSELWVSPETPRRCRYRNCRSLTVEGWHCPFLHDSEEGGEEQEWEEQGEQDEEEEHEEAEEEEEEQQEEEEEEDGM